MYELSISLSGERIDASRFLSAVSTLLSLLRAVDEGHEVHWRLGTLRYSSPATVGFIGEARKREAPNAAHVVGQAMVSGLTALDNGKRPPAFKDEALELAKKLSELKGRGGIDSLLLAGGNGHEPTTLAVSQRVAATVDEFIGAKYEAQGTIEGRLEVVSSHGGVLKCHIYERVLGKPVKCDVPAGLKAQVLAVFDQDVVAHGIIKRDASGHARQIRLESIAANSPPEEIPESLAGFAPDFTDGEEAAEYIKGRWK